MINEIAPCYTKKQSHFQYKKLGQPPITVPPVHIVSHFTADQSFKMDKEQLQNFHKQKRENDSIFL